MIKQIIIYVASVIQSHFSVDRKGICVQELKAEHSGYDKNQCLSIEILCRKRHIVTVRL